MLDRVQLKYEAKAITKNARESAYVFTLIYLAIGLVLDGSERVDGIIRSAMSWDVMGGVARRSWARNAHGMETAMDYNARRANEGHITIPYIVNDGIIEKAVADKMNK